MKGYIFVHTYKPLLHFCPDSYSFALFNSYALPYTPLKLSFIWNLPVMHFYQFLSSGTITRYSNNYVRICYNCIFYMHSFNVDNFSLWWMTLWVLKIYYKCYVYLATRAHHCSWHSSVWQEHECVHITFLAKYKMQWIDLPQTKLLTDMHIMYSHFTS